MKRLKFIFAYLLSMLVLILNSCSPKINSTKTLSDQNSPILIRARIWVQAKVPYGSFGFHNNPAYYDGYKADCSGFVSYAWGLQAPGIGTNQFVSENYATVIPISDLHPGDVLNNDQADTAGHMVIFVKWLDRTKNIFEAYDLNTDPGYTSEKIYTLVQIPNSKDWTISELDPWAHGPYQAERLTNPNGISITKESNPSQPNYLIGRWKYDPINADIEFLENGIVIIRSNDNPIAARYQILSADRVQISDRIISYSITNNSLSLVDTNNIEGSSTINLPRFEDNQTSTIDLVNQGCFFDLFSVVLVCNNYQGTLDYLNGNISYILNDVNSQNMVVSEIGIAHTTGNYVLIYYKLENNPPNSFEIFYESTHQTADPVGNLTDVIEKGINITSYEPFWNKK